MYDISTPWHVASYDRFLQETLPQLLTQRLPLTSYQAQVIGDQVNLYIRIAGAVDLAFQLPYPDQYGVFNIGGTQIVVLPVASHEELDTAQIACVGEQLLDFITTRLGEAPSHLEWDAHIAQAWLPLDTWVHEAFTPQQNHPTFQAAAQYLDQTNWLATQTHLRRIFVPNPQQLFTAGQIGRTCLFEVPEGPNMGRVFTIALGATIRDQRLVIIDQRPEATLGLAAACSPLLEHNEYPRQLMGVNMMRQWLTPPHPEAALVQTGLEPDHPLFWCGRNLLTAFISWDADTFEDGIVISAAAAQKFGYPNPLAVGDKFSNRHGAKGVISRILPGTAMPTMADGTPVELIVSMISVPSRLNFGQIREAVLGRIAHATSTPAIVPPFQAPDSDTLRAQLQAAGLPESGMEVLSVDGVPLMRPATVGWIYWGKLVHTASRYLRNFVGDTGLPRVIDEPDQPERSVAWPAWTPEGQQQGELEYYALRQANAFETIREQYNTRSAARPDAAFLAQRLAQEAVAQAGAPTPMFAKLQRRLAAAGIAMQLEGERLTTHFAEPAGDVLTLAQALPHPWLPERSISTIGILPEYPASAALIEANTRLAGMLGAGTPAVLVRTAQKQLESALADWADGLLQPGHLLFDQPTIFSARAVAAPGGTMLRYAQVGLAEEIAWALFTPWVIRSIGDPGAVERREESATAALDELLAQSWVLVGRAPALDPEAFVAFQPLRIPEAVVRMPSQACNLMNLDYDGDQVSVFLPITAAGQAEAAERLSLAAHLTRNPTLIREVRPRMDALLGLAALSCTAAGLEQIAQTIGKPITVPNGFIAAPAVVEILAAEQARAGAVAALDLSERLAQLGFAYARQTGFSLSPFIGESWGPSRPGDDSPASWQRYVSTVEAYIGAEPDFTTDIGVLLLAARSNARGNFRLLTSLVATRYNVPSLYESVAPVYGNMRDGLRLNEITAITGSTRTGMSELNRYWEPGAQALRERFAPRGEGILARAMHFARPGIVFALAARSEASDPLNDIDSRLFVGLNVN